MPQTILGEVFEAQPFARPLVKPQKNSHSCNCQKCRADAGKSINEKLTAVRKKFALLNPAGNNASLLSEVFIESETGTAKTGTAISANKVRHFFCNAADHKKVEDLLQMSVTTATLRSAVETAIATALPWIYNAIGALRVSPRSAATINIFRRAFAQNPDWNPSWKTSKMKWIDWGDLIATRLENAAHILNGGYIKYFCYGSKTHCSECTTTPPSYYACSSWKGKYVICLGHAFWNDWKNRDQDSMISTLIHEALHIYFGKTVAHAGRSANVSCYLRFVALINNRTLPSRISTRCPASP